MDHWYLYSNQPQDVFLRPKPFEAKESSAVYLIIYDNFLFEPKQLRWHIVSELPQDGYGADDNHPPKLWKIYYSPSKPPHMYVPESAQREGVKHFRQVLFDRGIL